MEERGEIDWDEVARAHEVYRDALLARHLGDWSRSLAAGTGEADLR